MTDQLVTPARAKEIKRAAARHAAGMIWISLSEWAPQQFAAADARNDAEEEVLREEVERIALEIRGRAFVGTSQPCSECGIPHRIKANGTLHHHNGMDRAGFSTGQPCLGVGKPPRNS
ncbi:hypothetical protein ACFVTT_23405 [Streptomyces niveus]|uniref:hypothetical protein n=1 Tax=Streptomyces niveus TaxID=193462 RepID=UPI003432A40A